MKRYVIYARFSSDKQNPMSSADQISLCSKYIEYKDDGMLVKSYFDDCTSGAERSRTGLIEMTEDAKNKMFDVIVVASQDRIYRDQAEMISFYNVMNFLHIKIHSLQEQEINDMNVMLLSFAGATYLKNISHHVKRGHQGALNRNVLPMDVAFGYTKNEQDKTWSINPAEAEIVKKIFMMKSKGATVSEILEMLHAQPILPKKAIKWTPDYVRRMFKKPIYKGLFVWGKKTKIRNPMTGIVENINVPEEKWTIRAYPHLRIVSDDIWEKAHPKKTKFNINVTRHGMAYPLYQKAVCAVCGNNMNISHSKKKYGVYRYLSCRNISKTNIPPCTAIGWIRLEHITDDVFAEILDKMQQNPSWAKDNIQQYITVDKDAFEKIRPNMISEMFKAKSFEEYLAYMHKQKAEKKVDMQKIINTLESAIKTYGFSPKDLDAVAIMQTFVKSVHAKRTVTLDTTQYEYTWEIDWQAIANNLDMFE